jgi:hypothetical protein
MLKIYIKDNYAGNVYAIKRCNTPENITYTFLYKGLKNEYKLIKKTTDSIESVVEAYSLKVPCQM